MTNTNNTPALYDVTLISPKDGRRNRRVARFAVVAATPADAEATVRRLNEVHLDDTWTLYSRTEVNADGCANCGSYDVPCNAFVPSETR